MQSPGSSIKQQKLNVFSSCGTATLLTKQNRLRLSACHRRETPGMQHSHSLGKSWRRGEGRKTCSFTSPRATSTEGDGGSCEMQELKGCSHPNSRKHAALPDQVGKKQWQHSRYQTRLTQNHTKLHLRAADPSSCATREHPVTQHRAPWPSISPSERGWSFQLQLL